MFSLRIVHLTIIAAAMAMDLFSGVRLSAAETRRNPMIAGQEQLKAVRASLAGTWTCDIGQVKEVLTFRGDGQFKIGDTEGEYGIQGNTLTLHSGGDEVTYDFKLEGKKLTLSGGDLVWPLELTKVPRLGEPGSWLGGWSLPSLKVKLRRIVVILLVVVASQLVLRCSRALSHLVIYSEWGPLKFLYRRHKKRTMTIYSLVLNVSKYAIYLLAVGFVLTELGINYTVYFASLSVIGLAIGFGSQGLVQDMVTGFFIVFEEQFNVGDMVEIPPHTGIVEELGLRMTRLRNYLGQRVVIPNRNIAAVGNYTRGAQHVYLDVAVAEEAHVGKATEILKRTAEEIARQFQDIILSAPESRGAISLSTGEHLVRLHLSIWPQQQWVVDQELVPRTCAAMKNEGVEVPNDKVTVFYHPREGRSISRRRRR